MPFVMLIQEPDADGRFNSERFVCFEVNSTEEAEERATWFGINLAEIDNGASRRWWWYSNRRTYTRPEISGHPVEELDRWGHRGEGWVIVYRNGNLRSSMALPYEV